MRRGAKMRRILHANLWHHHQIRKTDEKVSGISRSGFWSRACPETPIPLRP